MRSRGGSGGDASLPATRQSLDSAGDGSQKDSDLIATELAKTVSKSDLESDEEESKSSDNRSRKAAVNGGVDSSNSSEKFPQHNGHTDEDVSESLNNSDVLLTSGKPSFARSPNQSLIENASASSRTESELD